MGKVVWIKFLCNDSFVDIFFLEPLLLDLQSGTSAALRDRSPLSSSGEPVALPVNPLTRDQLQQALIHLIKVRVPF